MFDRVLVANRGEIAIRIIKACQELDIETIAVYSDADENAKHVRFADEAKHIGASKAKESYLDQEALLNAGLDADADAIHPGYGFLAESEEFAAYVENSACTWVGPPSEVMGAFGEKTRARDIMMNADVPVVPGTTKAVTDAEEVHAFGNEHGYPVAIKAAGGGGGRGFRIVEDPEEAESQLRDASREADAYFDNPDVYLERFLEDPKHIEVQILADEHGNVRHFGERDCSIQRRQQKLVEESPSPALDEGTREEICDAAHRGAAAADYVNAGTVEFLYEDDEFYFIETNARIQVEHPVTELRTGVDLVKWQLRIAAGEELDFVQEDVDTHAAAMEFRINAEDPENDFTPLPGTLSTYDPPRGIGIRVDDGIDEGDTIAPFYDSMFAKFVVYGEDREEVLARARRVLNEATVEGIPTTIPFHRDLLEDDVFLENRHTTKYVDRMRDNDET